ncbi:class I SAM-dependent DNA methyltransferase [Oryzobacter terrae]|uniref:class I SAM-dependent DNA methyltransferase n=1 Tax=Oryzobacter terrae TaxID=1620385 RepID=UPI003671668E
MTSSDLWTAETAARYDEASAAMFAPEVLDPTVDRLAALAGDGPVLELAVGTGRVAVPLAARGLAVSGIELSQPMVDRLHAKSPDLPVVVGDMATATVPGDGSFSLVYLVFNTLGNLRTQAEQVACFRNAARHLAPGGRFLVEIGVPSLRRLPPGQTAVPFDVGEDHLGFDTYDLVGQQGTSHHYTREADGGFRYGVHHYRYVWPEECDLMAQLAGLERESRWGDWHGAPFTGDSESHVSVWRRPAQRWRPAVAERWSALDAVESIVDTGVPSAAASWVVDR